MPRRGAPQPHGPGSAAANLADEPETAKTESIFFTLPLSHFLQVTRLDEEATIFSNLVPQSLHWNSKMGMGDLACRFRDHFNIAKSKIAYKPPIYVSLYTGVRHWAEPHFWRVSNK
jgi:hypothetical protein